MVKYLLCLLVGYLLSSLVQFVKSMRSGSTDLPENYAKEIDND